MVSQVQGSMAQCSAGSWRGGRAARLAMLALLAGSSVAMGQGTLVPIPPHSGPYVGFTRGFTFTAGVPFVISRLELPPEMFEPGNTSGFVVRINGNVALRSVGNSSEFITPNVWVNPGDVVDIMGNWSPPVTGNFTARNSYAASGDVNTTIEGVPHTLRRSGWQWDIADPSWESGTYLAPTVGQIGRIFMYTQPQSLDPGGCCFSNGTCQLLSGPDCFTQGGTFRGPGTDCAAPCPQPGACCFINGSCEVRLEASCTTAGGTWNGANTDCTINPCPQPPTGACCTALGCVILNTFDCTAQGGIYQGDNTVCGTLCDAYHFEVHPNNTKAEANAITLPHGHSIVGRSTAATGTADPASPDYFLVKTQPAALGIYQHKMTLNNATTVGNSAWIRGLSQTAAAAGPWPGPVGTASATENIGQSHQLVGTSRVNMWYGFGKEEQVYYRVSGLASTTGNYVATLETTPVSPVDIGSFMAGEITITTTGQGHTNDTHIRIYDAQLNPIHGYANDGASINGGAPANLTTTSFLRREYVAGTYYMAIALTNLATDQGSPCDDNVRTGAMMDFPNVAVDTGTVTATDVSFAIIDGTGTTPIPASRGGRGEIAWFKFTVSGTVETGACCFPNGTCEVLTVAACNGQGGTYQGNNTPCTPGLCPQPPEGACCLPTGACTIANVFQCTAANGSYQGAGTVCAGLNCPVIVISNMPGNDATLSATLNGGRIKAMGFAMPAGDDYMLDRIEMRLGMSSTAIQPLVRLYDDVGNAPGTLLATLVSPPVTITGIQTYTVTPAEPLSLLAGQRYWLVVWAAATGLDWRASSPAQLPTGIASHFGSLFSTVTGPNPPLANETSVTINSYGVFGQPASQPCYANCDGSTVEPILNIDDFTCFINEFATGQTLPPEQQVTHYSNCDGSTVHPVLNIDDFTCFINGFALGCP